MGLDSCTLILNYENVPIEIHVMNSKYLNRVGHNKLCVFISGHNILPDGQRSSKIYEIDGKAIQTLSDSGTTILDKWNLSCITDFFSDVLDYEGAEERFAKDPRSGMPAPEVHQGYRLFLFFEG